LFRNIVHASVCSHIITAIANARLQIKETHLEPVQQTPRSQAAKDRIVAAARSLFAEVGYDRATVRQIAERADVVPAMLVRYFGGKAGLFAAAIQLDVVVPSLDGMDPRLAGETLVAHFLERWESGDSGGDLVALLRASVDHPDARERILLLFSDQLSSALTQVSNVREESTAAALIASQMLGLIFCRYVLDIPPLRTIARDDLIHSVGQVLGVYLAEHPTAKSI
jgi:AcrR family transcriptional regulator